MNIAVKELAQIMEPGTCLRITLPNDLGEVRVYRFIEGLSEVSDMFEGLEVHSDVYEEYLDSYKRLIEKFVLNSTVKLVKQERPFSYNVITDISIEVKEVTG